MIGFDTNVLVRYLTRDDREQAVRAKSFLTSLSSGNPGFIPLATLVELVWVMQSRYDISKAEIINSLGMFLRTYTVTFDERAAKAAGMRLVS